MKKIKMIEFYLKFRVFGCLFSEFFLTGTSSVLQCTLVQFSVRWSMRTWLREVSLTWSTFRRRNRLEFWIRSDIILLSVLKFWQFPLLAAAWLPEHGFIFGDVSDLAIDLLTLGSEAQDLLLVRSRSKMTAPCNYCVYGCLFRLSSGQTGY